MLFRDGREMHLTPKPFDLLLLLLIDEAPRVVLKRELHDRLWPGTFVSDATLVGLVKELRRAFEDRDRSAPFIRTANRVGYGFARALQVVDSQDAFRHWLAGSSRRFSLQRGENLIGRDPESIVWVDAGSVSRRHARIIVDAAEAKLEDLDSKNGTKVCGRDVTSPVLLCDGDVVTVGAVRLTYHTSASNLSTETHGG